MKASPFDDLARDVPLDPPPEPPSRGLFGGEAKSAAPPPQVALLSTLRSTTARPGRRSQSS